MAMRGSSNIREGMDVFDVDGDKIGSVDEIASAGYMKVKTGLLGLGGSWYIPLEVVREVRSDNIYLSVDKDDAGRLNWSTPPTTTGRQGVAATQDTTVSQEQTRTTGRTADTEAERTVQLREEQLRVQKEQAQAGEVRIGKEVVSEQQTIDVPVMREEVVIERHAVEGGRPAEGEIGTGEEIRVPVREETARAVKETVVTEEIEVGKRAVQETEQVSGTVRREEARIEREGEVDVSGDATTRGDAPRRGDVPPRRS